MNPRSARTRAELARPLDHRLKVYCLAAAASGVSLMALSEPAAQAEIVYTPAQARVPFQQWYKVDLNHDGIPDISFILTSSTNKVIDRALTARPAQSQGAIIGYAGLFFPYASALPKGAPISAAAPFAGGDQIMDRTEINHYDASFTFSAGAWRKAKGLYLGVKFIIDGAVHYGWIRLSVAAPHKLNAVITGYAYETIADRPISAGQASGRGRAAPDPASLETAGPTQSRPTVSTANALNCVAQPAPLGVLALGSAGLTLWRR